MRIAFVQCSLDAPKVIEQGENTANCMTVPSRGAVAAAVSTPSTLYRSLEALLNLDFTQGYFFALPILRELSKVKMKVSPLPTMRLEGVFIGSEMKAPIVV
jgi:hypothetical protein